MIWASALAALCVALLGVTAWRLSTHYSCASIADIFWPLHHLLSALILLSVMSPELSLPGYLTIGLVTCWAIRLATHLTLRQIGADEDRRYETIRQRIGDDFDRKSLYLIFIPQALMAWFISLLLLPALAPLAPWNWIGYAGLLLATLGLIWEITADLQLASFLRQRENDRVMDQGLWSLCRHPNYFGEWLFWLGLALTTVSLAPPTGLLALLPMALLTFLLMRFTGVARTETGITNRRPGYLAYQRQTPAFFPNPRRLLAQLRRGDRPLSSKRGVSKGWWLLVLCVNFVSIDNAKAEPQAPQNWYFDVKLDDKELGFHEFVATADERGYDVVATAAFRYAIFGVTLFSYEHKVRERYDENLCLQEIESTTKTNGNIERLRGFKTGEGFAIETDAGSSTETGCLLTFAYWTPKLLSQKRILNGQSGDVVEIDVSQQTSANGSPALTFYSVNGRQLDLTLGYDSQGHWRTLESTLKNGRNLSYHLRQ